MKASLLLAVVATRPRVVLAVLARVAVAGVPAELALPLAVRAVRVAEAGRLPGRPDVRAAADTGGAVALLARHDLGGVVCPPRNDGTEVVGLELGGVGHETSPSEGASDHGSANTTEPDEFLL